MFEPGSKYPRDAESRIAGGAEVTVDVARLVETQVF